MLIRLETFAWITACCVLNYSDQPASSSKLNDISDLDFLVEFQPKALETYADNYFGLLENLQRLFGKPVGLVVGSAVKNPYYLQSIDRTKTLVYEATRPNR